ncbi:glutamate synthase (NADPH) GltB2 subunit [Dethiosulfatibacter aminovorans DSM 17477]|uniref:Glutamate synthase (NADPH) GltB2 subunit n=1 Tax=Dethiosulfatibacter aminovorans DSM 17477 TaxID=1121476 RepID=A0A1M6GB89_9FIRM|nr:glutamate synthase-related protein [Dethiosulfatibacter aminovorans]SHJ07226.1 glutamate synthase (NADPH) GltB2 subunit [Dethiosulfatibacter aminovorans DSM 17477]
MTYSPSLSSAFNKTNNRSSKHSPQSGMCSLCTEECTGTCEIGLAAVLGARTVYPTTTGTNQVASEKDYPVDYSHFNINGHVFGAIGCNATYEEATIFNVNLQQEFGKFNTVRLNMPVILPAVVKLNWEDYYAGAAMAGVVCVIGEDARNKDPELKIENGKVVHFPALKKMLDSFRKYYRGYGQIVLQCNVEDDMLGIPEYAITKQGSEAIEFKFGQAAKGTQPASKLKDRDEALKKKALGIMVHPDPNDPEITEAYEKGVCPNFYSYGRLPLWEEEYLVKRIAELRDLGAKNIYFKMAGYDPLDLEKVIRIGSNAEVDLITFDGAGGGSGYSPCKMMNEWALPTVSMESAICGIVDKLKEEGLWIPKLVVTGGFASEDQVFKALAFGDGRISAVGICRAAMAAAMTGKKVGEMIREGNIPNHLKEYGETVDDIYGDLPDLRALYGMDANEFPTGAIGVFSYLNKIAFGLRHFAALNRKFDIKYVDRSDLIPLTRDVKDLY